MKFIDSNNRRIVIREVKESELEEILNLYNYLGMKDVPSKEEALDSWTSIMNCKYQHIVVAEEEGKLVSSCVVTIIPNLTHSHRPYGVIENVVTDENYRKQGLATACLDYAKEIAIKEGCYKLMLATGSKKESTLRFYNKAGYNQNDKIAFVQWI